MEALAENPSKVISSEETEEFLQLLMEGKSFEEATAIQREKIQGITAEETKVLLGEKMKRVLSDVERENLLPGKDSELTDEQKEFKKKLATCITLGDVNALCTQSIKADYAARSTISASDFCKIEHYLRYDHPTHPSIKG